MIATRSCYAQPNADRIRAYHERVRDLPDYDHLAHAGRVAAGVRRQGELVRLPIPRHRALTVYKEPSCQPTSLTCAPACAPTEKVPTSVGSAIASDTNSRAAVSRSTK